jgi:hypothetical protein
VAVSLCVTERFCKMEDLRLEVDDKGFTRISPGKPNARVATSIQKDDYLNWFVERFTSGQQKSPQKEPVNVAKLIPCGPMPNRVHVAEDYETDIEKRWWMSGKAETANLPPGSKRANRGVLTQDFDGKMGDLTTMYTAVIFNPVPGPPMGKNPRLSFRYFLQGTDTLRVQIYSLSNGYHRFLTLTSLPQGKWESATVDMTLARKPDGSGGPLSEGERIDDIQFYTDLSAELIIDDIVLYDEAAKDEKRPFPRQIFFTGWFDTGKQGQEWPGTFNILPKKGIFGNAAQSIENPALKTPWIRLHLRGERTLAEKTHLSCRYHLSGANKMEVALVNARTKTTQKVHVENLHKDKWAETVIDLTKVLQGSQPNHRLFDEIHLLLPPAAELLIDDLLLYEP